MAEETLLSVIDSLMPWVYIGHMLYFPSCDPLVPQMLKDGLARTIKDAPYLAQKLYHKERPKGRLAFTGPPDPLDKLFSWQDCSDEIDYLDLRAKNFPSPDSDASPLIPPETRRPIAEPAPVFRALLTTVKGGSLLWVAVHHSTTDITGFGKVLQIWATNCRLGSLESIGFNPKWLDRTVLKFPTDAVVGMPNSLHVRAPRDILKRPGGSISTVFEMNMFRFSNEVLRRVKAEASHDLQSHGVDWLSTNDVLTALLWSAIVKAEAADEDPKLVDPTPTIGIPVNCRNILRPPLPEGYVGTAFGKTGVVVERERLLEAANTGSPRALTAIAAAIRRSILQVDDNYIRTMLSFLEAQDDLTSIQLGPPPDTDSITSWADAGVYDLDWGDGLGRCESVRLHNLNGKRYPIVFPRLPSKPGEEGGGGLEVLISLKKDTMARLKQGPLMRENAVVLC